MTDVRWVGPPASGLGGKPRLIGGLLAALLALLVIKPWGTGGASPSAGAVPAPSSGSPEPSPLSSRMFDPLGHYDPAIFGIHEPAPGWAIWPAGFLVTFGFVIQVSGDTPPSAGPPASSPTSSAAADAGPSWPASFVVPAGNHLFLVGLDMPTGVALSTARLQRTDVTGEEAVVPITQLRSPWPSHFAVLGIEDGSGGLRVWDAGGYRLDLAFVPGPIDRTVEIRIERTPTH